MTTPKRDPAILEKIQCAWLDFCETSIVRDRRTNAEFIYDLASAMGPALTNHEAQSPDPTWDGLRPAVRARLSAAVATLRRTGMLNRSAVMQAAPKFAEPYAAMAQHAPASRTAVDEMIAARRKALAA